MGVVIVSASSTTSGTNTPAPNMELMELEGRSAALERGSLTLVEGVCTVVNKVPVNTYIKATCKPVTSDA